MPHAVVVGARGMLGLGVSAHFARAGYRVTGLGRSEFDIARDRPEKLEELLKGCDLVVNCAGVIKPRIAAMSVEDVLRVNAIFPRNLARLCGRRGIACYHVTTDCAYSGRKGSYTEEDLFDAEDLYGMSKNAGDTAESMVLRTSIIGEERGQARSLLEWARSQAGKEVNGFVNHRWNGVTTVHLGELVQAIQERGLYRKGIFHVYSPQVVTKAELLELVSGAYDLRLTVKPVEAKDFCDRSLSSVHSLASDLCRKRLDRQLREMRQLLAAA